MEVRATTETNAPDSRLSDKVVTDGCFEDILTTHTLKYYLLMVMGIVAAKDVQHVHTVNIAREPSSALAFL